jgi:L-lactate dehydrogenase complex protein LldG
VKPEQRQRMRERIGGALRTAFLPGAAPDPPGAYQGVDVPPADLLARFVAEITSLGGQVHEVPGADAATVAELIASIVPSGSPRSALAWDDRHFPVAGMHDALVARGFTIVPQDARDRTPEHRDALASCSVGITGVDALMAETGSIGLAAGPGRSRLASLLPPVHVAVAARTQLVYSLPELLLARPDLATAGSNFVCITGPSRTADIEHTLSRGVHGPGEVWVVVV